MAEDKRAEAMRRAVAEATGKSAGSDNSGKSKNKLNLKELSEKHGDKINGIKDKFLELWENKTGRLAIIAAGGILLLIIFASIISSGSSKVQDAPVQYKISDAVLCVYEADTGSGYAYDAYVEITNTGSSNIYARDAQFMVQDHEGSRIMIDKNIRAFPAVIEPGQKGYLFNQFGTELTGVYAKDLTLSLIPAFAMVRAEKVPYSYPVSNVTVGYGSLGQKMACQLTNNTANLQESIYCVGLTYNKDGRCTGISGTFLTGVEAHVTVNVQFDPMTMIRPWRNEQVVDYLVRAY